MFTDASEKILAPCKLAGLMGSLWSSPTDIGSCLRECLIGFARNIQTRRGDSWKAQTSNKSAAGVLDALGPHGNSCQPLLLRVPGHAVSRSQLHGSTKNLSCAARILPTIAFFGQMVREKRCVAWSSILINAHLLIGIRTLKVTILTFDDL